MNRFQNTVRAVPQTVILKGTGSMTKVQAWGKAVPRHSSFLSKDENNKGKVEF